ncbi:MAG TPA: substrate-binding domain-containing protein [Jatrophihabitantaceae bacterium]|nr:substrate-binding domain-containing protein [Jatrophihabitantaceae bacterium]
MQSASQPTPRHRTTRRTVAAVAALTAGSLVLAACSSSSNSGSGGSGGSGKVGVALILKTLTNPYFVSMEKDAKTEASKDNVKLTVAAGKTDGDTQTQISAIDNAISRGDKGILITINGDAVNTELAKARKAGLFVIALDTAPTPVSTVDITYATDNEEAGKLVGQYAAAKLGGKKAVIAMLDLFDNQVVSVDTSRDHGFLEGMGIDPGSTSENGKEAKSGHYTGGKGGDYQVVCHQPTQGAVPGGKTAMENCLSKNGDVNVVYTINEPAADGAIQALNAAGKKNVIVVTIDGSCKYVNGQLKNGTIAADAAQYPGKMASQGVSTIASLARGGTKPTLPSGQDFINTGTALVTADPIAGLQSQTPAEAAKACWGS